jgi:hypothetical protein
MFLCIAFCFSHEEIFVISVVDDDFGRDDYLGECTINLERLHLSNTPTKIEEVIDSKKGGGWFSRKATVSVEISYTK